MVTLRILVLNSCFQGEDFVIASLDVEPYVGPACA